MGRSWNVCLSISIRYWQAGLGNSLGAREGSCVSELGTGFSD